MLNDKTMEKHYTKFTTALSIILLLVLIRFPGFGDEESGDTYIYSDPIAEYQIADRTDNVLLDFNNALVNLVEAANPTVVTVSTKATVQVRNQHPFDFGPFREFFGQPQERTRERELRGMGSGVIVSDDGYIITNNHVIQRADTITVRLINGDNLAATVVGTDPATDVAVLKVDAENLPYMTFGNSDDVRVGEMVLAIGSPLQEHLAHTVSKGIVSAKGRSNLNILGEGGFEDFIQTDAAINRGNSGGPLINMEGQIIGINTAIASQTGGFQGIGFSIPSNMVTRVMESIIETGTIVRSYIGISLSEVTEELARAFNLPDNRGIIVNQVMDDSPAQKAGLKDGDIILRKDGRRVGSSREFRTSIANKRPGTDVTLTVFRDGNEVDVKITVGEMKPDKLATADDTDVQDMVGFSVTELTGDLARQLRVSSNLRGVVVEGIDESATAFENGLRQGDVIIAVNRQQVTDISEFQQRISGVRPGDMVLLQVVRRNQRFFVAFELAS